VANDPHISLEFFPPRTPEQRDTLLEAWRQLEPQGPDYVSVTFGAGGSTLDATRETVMALAAGTDVPVAPHISCMAHSEKMLRRLLTAYRDGGIRRLVVLRGDRPQGVAQHGPFHHANELVAFIRREFGDSFHLEVACYPEFHPESESPASELHWFKQKVEAGADGAVTQYFYNADSYFQFVDDCRRAGIEIPITPGIMPIGNYAQLARFPACAAPRYRNGCGAGSRVSATTGTRSPSSGWTWSPGSASGCWRAAPRACTSTP